MALDRTAGFDLLVQVGESEINSQVAAAFAAGLLLPSSLSVPVDAFGVNGHLDLDLTTPFVDLDRSPGQLGITTRFTNSQLEITAPVTATVAPLAGTIAIVDSVQIRSQAGTQQAVLDFAAGAPTVTVTLDPATVTLLTPTLSGLGVSVAAAQNALADIVRQHLADDIQRMPLSPPIPVADDSDPLTPFSIDVTTVNDTSVADRDALTFGVRTDASSGGNIHAIGQSFIPGGGQSVLMMSNFWLLARVIRPKLAQALGRPVSDFDTPLRLNHPIPAPGGHGGTLTNLEARIDGNRIRVDGRATDSGTGWSAVATFSFFIDLSLSGGQIQIVASSPSVHTEISLEWWVWLASIGLGAIFGGIIGAIVGAIVPTIVIAVAEGIADRLATEAFNNATSNIPPVPLGPLGAGLTLSSILLDDLELRGPVQRALNLPVKSSGQHRGTGAFAIDLDSGAIFSGPGEVAPRDLNWAPGAGIHALNGAGLSISGQPYAALTPLQLRAYGFGTVVVQESGIPLSLDLPFFGIHSEIVLAVRTSQGRLAKVRAWREVGDGTLNLFWTTYDTPVPTLDLALRWSETETGERTTFPGSHFQLCERYEVARRCDVEAWPRLVAFPVDYQWCLCGTVLDEGEGELEHAGATIRYRIDGRHLEFETELGAAIDCELCVSAIDARGHELFTCVPLQRDGTETKCRGGRDFYPKPSVELIPCDPLKAVDTWQPVLSEAVQKQLVGALSRKDAKRR